MKIKEFLQNSYVLVDLSFASYSRNNGFQQRCKLGNLASLSNENVSSLNLISLRIILYIYRYGKAVSNAILGQNNSREL